MTNRQENQLYIGIDLNDSRAVISFYRTDMSEPKEAASVADSNRTEFPLAVLRMGNGKYYYGEEAIHFRDEAGEGAVFRDDLYRKALSEEEDGEKEDLFRLVRRLLYFRKQYEKDRSMPYDLTVTIPEVSAEAVTLLEDLRISLSVTREHFRITDYRESFFDYISLQDSSIWKQDTCLFDLSEEDLVCMRAHRVSVGNDRYMEVEKRNVPVDIVVYHDNVSLDHFVAQEISDTLATGRASGVYLIGDRFEGNWRKETMEAIGSNKRIFIGKNIYSRGACLGACRMRTVTRPMVRYQCEYRIRSKRFLRLLDQGKQIFWPLVIDHANWFESYVSGRLLYNGKQHLEIWDENGRVTQTPVTVLDLQDFPKRPEKAMYLDIRAYPMSEQTLCIEISDAGFGSFYESGKKTWRFELEL